MRGFPSLAAAGWVRIAIPAMGAMLAMDAIVHF